MFQIKFAPSVQQYGFTVF
uniref:Uncharacterized protein n=1 Tax=Anguilla anguilla TaxID=7936 RepID=A0A0E9XYP1_ANGAN